MRTKTGFGWSITVSSRLPIGIVPFIGKSIANHDPAG